MKKNRLLSLALCLAVMLPGCGKKEENAGNPPAPSGGATPAKKLKLAFVSNNAANFWTIARTGCDEAAKELGDVEVDFRIPSDAQAATQQQILNDLIVRGEDGIAVSPIDPANETGFLNKIAGQALLVTADSDAPDSKRVCYIGTDNVAAGRQAGALIKEVIPQGGKIMIFVGKLDAQNAKERFQGIKEVLQGSNAQIIDVRTDDTDQTRAQQNAADTLVKYPDVACLVGLWNYNGPAIARAVKGAGKSGQVKIVCFDENQETLDGVSSGLIYGTVVQQPYEFGKQAITRMDKYLRGDKSQLAGGKIIIPTMVIKQAEVADFEVRLKKLLGQ